MAALHYAYLGSMRLNAARLNSFDPQIYVTVAGVAARARILGASVREISNSAPNTATLRVSGSLPQPGQDVKINLGSKAPQGVIFGGTVQRRRQVKEGAITNPPAFDLELVDYAWTLDRRRVFGQYTNVSASTIVLDLMTRYGAGFTTRGVALDLPAVTVKFQAAVFSEALSEIANLCAGVRWKVDYGRDLIFGTAASQLQARTITPATVETFEQQLDVSQVRTRNYVKGIGVQLTAAAAPGATTLQLDDVTPFLSPGSGSVISDDGQIINYTGVQADGYAPGTGPGSGPIIAAPAPPVPVQAYAADAVDVNFTTTTNGSTDYRIVTVQAHGLAVGQPFFIQQGGGAGALVVASVTNSTEFHAVLSAASSITQTQNGGLVRGCLLASSIRTRAGVCTITTPTPHGLAAGMSIVIGLCTPTTYEGVRAVSTVPSPTTFTISMSGNPADAIPAGTGNAGIPIFAATAGALVGAYNYEQSLASDTAETAASAASSAITVAGVASLSAAALLSFTPQAGGNLIAGATYGYGVTGVTAAGGETTLGALATPTMPAGQGTFNIGINLAVARDARVVAVNIWRSLAPGGVPNQPLKYIGTAAVGYRGVAMSFQDTLAENQVGGPAPSASTANAAVLVSSLAIGDPRVSARRIYRNTPAAATTYKRVGEVPDNVSLTWLDTIPDTQQAGGATAPTTPIGQFGAPGQLTGIPASGAGAIAIALIEGATVYLWVQRDDTAAQAALAALGFGDGVIEYLLEDETIATVATAAAAGDADLQQFNKAEPKVTAAGRDTALVAGAPVSVNMPAPTSVVGDFVVSAVTISQMGVALRLYPLRTIEASTTRYTLTDFLRRIALAA